LSLEQATDAGWLSDADTIDPAKVAHAIQMVWHAAAASAAKSVTT
jgi:hypothetical protein